MAPKVTLYGHEGPTPNPFKVIIMLEALGIEYTIIRKGAGDGPNGLKAPDFLAINPNGRVPALVDHTNNDLVIWESGAILLYLAERFDTQHKFGAATLNERAEIWEWLMYQMSGLGPIQGQVNWFLLFHPIKPPELHPSVVERYQNETRRVYGVLEKRLSVTDWIALDRFTIVDIAFFPWLNIAQHAQINLDDFPKLKAYIARVKALDCVEKAYAKLK